ncbi:MAG: substrate-binding domain-containing protein [Pseudomonadota bacterium]
MKQILTWVFVSLITATNVMAQDQVRMAVTTSFHNSGLADVLVPEIKKELDLEVQLLVVGTGQALRLGRAGDVDAILVHSRAAEETFVAEGYGPYRREIMFNDFVLIGPVQDSAGIQGAQTAADALARIQTAKASFVSRGDDSGTHKKELNLWEKASLDPSDFGGWYRAVGAGMGAALNTASGLDAYIMSDRASWLNFGNQGSLALLFSGDPVLFNQYAFLPVSVERHPHVKADLVAKLEGWLTSQSAQVLIDGYTINGETLFTFNAN